MSAVAIGTISANIFSDLGTGLPRPLSMNARADAVYAIVSVPWMITKPS